MMPLSTAVSAVRRRPALVLSLSLGLLVAGCDDGTPPPARQIPPSAPATAAPAAPTTPAAPKPSGITDRNVLGKWIIEPSGLREAVFNRALSVDQGAGTGYTDRQLEEGTMHAVTDEMSRRDQYSFTSDGKFVIQYGQYRDKIEGTWKLEGDVVTLTPKSQKVHGHQAHLAVKHQYKVTKDKLIFIPGKDRYRAYTLIRDVPV